MSTGTQASMKFVLRVLLLPFLTYIVSCGQPEALLAMPDVQAEYEDQYLCTSFSPETTLNIQGFAAKRDDRFAHHMIIYACQEEPQEKKVWDCLKNRICENSAEKILFSWAMGGGDLKFPDGTSMVVGAGTGRPQLVLQVHYVNVDKMRNMGETDHSGINLLLARKEPKYDVQTHISVVGGYIPERSVVYLDSACEATNHIPWKPLFFRTHAHGHSELNSVFIIDRVGNWKLVGARSPREPQTFVPVAAHAPHLEKGDIIAARCVMNNTLGDKQIIIGETKGDEMCNVYVMFQVPKNVNPTPGQLVCSSAGYPEQSWEDDFLTEEIPKESITNPKTHELMLDTVEDY